MLLKNGERVRIGSRAFALLNELAKNAGRFVRNEDLMSAGWPGVFVEDANLRVQMTSLRRLLGDERSGSPYISNAPGRGYALTAKSIEPVAATVSPRPVPHSPLHEDRPSGLPVPLTPLIGRQESVSLAIERLKARRLVSIVGPGGIGKTRLALEVCWNIGDLADWRTIFVDLAPLSTGDFVRSAIAVALELDQDEPSVSLEPIIKALQQSETLLVLDNCEHVLDAAAELAERILRSVPGLRILTTSREPLRVEGEATLRLMGLEVPENDLSDTAALRFAAVELFLESIGDDVKLGLTPSADFPLISRICRRLDGIPLAIELAAARVSQIGLKELARHMDDQFAILSEGRRTSVPRHRTLTATMEWSYGGLNQAEQELLCRLSVFRSTFALSAVTALLDIAPAAAVSLLSGLVNKSLIVADHGNGEIRYRLLETTRAFADIRLKSFADVDVTRKRHAGHLVELFRTPFDTDEAWMDRPKAFNHIVDDVRAALAWSTTGGGDLALGAQLILYSAPMWLKLSLLSEYAAVLEQMVNLLSRQEDIHRSDLLPVYAMIHHAHYNAIGLAPKIENMVKRGLSIARQMDDIPHRRLFLYNMYGTRLTQGRYHEALEYAEEFEAVTAEDADVSQQAFAQRIMSLGLWRAGRLNDALGYGARALSATVDAQSPVNHTLLYKQGVTSGASQANLLWLMGYPDQAAAMADDAVEVGLQKDVTGLCYALSQLLVPLSFWLGDDARTRSYIDLLIERATRSHLGFWLSWGKCYDALLNRSDGDAGGADFLARNVDGLSGIHRHVIATIRSDADLRVDIGSEPSTPLHWATAELLRRQALKMIGDGQLQEAEALLDKAMAIASSQGAKAWQLRIASTSADLKMQQSKHGDAGQLLLPILSSFKEGHATADLKIAEQLARKIRPQLRVVN